MTSLFLELYWPPSWIWGGRPDNSEHYILLEVTKAEIDCVKNKLAKIVAKKTQGTIVRNRTRWYEFGKKNN